MKGLIGFILAVIFCAATVVSAQDTAVESEERKASPLTASAQKKILINPASVYKQFFRKQDLITIVTVVSPNQADWSVLDSSKVKTIFEKRAPDEILNAGVRMFTMEPFAADEDMLKSFESIKKEELEDEYKRDSIHFYFVTFKETPCLQYDGIFNFKEAKPKFKYFNIRGYLCAHPENKNTAVQMEFSNHSNLRGFSKDFFSLSDEFFEKTTFSKEIVK